MKNKKLIIILITLGVILLSLGIYFLLKEKDSNEETKAPDTLLNNYIEQQKEISINETNEKWDISKSEPLYYAEEITNISSVEQLIYNMGFDYQRNKAIVENHYTWGDPNTDAYFGYSTEDNVLDISIRNPRKAITKLTRENAEQIVNNYLNSLGLQHKYKMLKLITENDYSTIYLGRIIQEYHVETSREYGATDMLTFSNQGELVYAQLLFAKFTNKLNYNVPLIEIEDLLSVINEEQYPKEIRIDDINFLESRSAEEINPVQEGPLDTAVETITETITDCTPTDIELVYYYPGRLGIYMLPTYKIDCVSTATYEEVEYTVPSVVYTNAVSPEYISAE